MSHAARCISIFLEFDKGPADTGPLERAQLSRCTLADRADAAAKLNAWAEQLLDAGAAEPTTTPEPEAPEAPPRTAPKKRARKKHPT